MKITINIEMLRAIVKISIDEKMDLQGSMARCTGMPQSNNRPYLAEIFSRSAAMSVIAHEAVHAAAFILEYKGISPQHDQMELTAYLVQHICEKAESHIYDLSK